MLDLQTSLGGFAVLLGLIGYVPYFRDIFLGKTRPHIFSWLVWGLLTAIAFGVQLQDGAGPGSWVTGFTAAVCFVIALLAVWRGEKEITISDWVAFGGALAGLVFWQLVQDPLIAVVLITLADLLGFAPTFRKAWARPFQETVSTYLLSGIKFVFGLAALTSFSLESWLYPASLVLTNFVFISMVLLRRRMLDR